jgi:exodeoxyribonuclease VII small subunit
VDSRRATMSDDRSTFETTKARLEDIVVQVRRKDVSLEQSLDMLEEAVRLVNQCNDLIDQTSFKSASEAAAVEADAATEADLPAVADAVPGTGEEPAAEPAEGTPSDAADEGDDEGEDASVEVVALVETFDVLDIDGDEIEFVEFVEVADVSEPAELEDDERA